MHSLFTNSFYLQIYWFEKIIAETVRFPEEEYFNPFGSTLD